MKRSFFQTRDFCERAYIYGVPAQVRSRPCYVSLHDPDSGSDQSRAFISKCLQEGHRANNKYATKERDLTRFVNIWRPQCGLVDGVIDYEARWRRPLCFRECFRQRQPCHPCQQANTMHGRCSVEPSDVKTCKHKEQALLKLVGNFFLSTRRKTLVVLTIELRLFTPPEGNNIPLWERTKMSFSY